MKELTGDDKLFGIWRHEIWRGLLWIRAEASREWKWKQPTENVTLLLRIPPKPITSYLALSWSWASIEGTINHLLAGSKSYDFKFINVRITHPDDDLSLISTARLVVIGRLRHAMLTRRGPTYIVALTWMKYPRPAEYIWPQTQTLIAYIEQAHNTHPMVQGVLPTFDRLQVMRFPPKSPCRDLKAPLVNRLSMSKRPYVDKSPDMQGCLRPKSYSDATSLPRHADTYYDHSFNWHKLSPGELVLKEVHCLEVTADLGLVLQPVADDRGTFERVACYTCPLMTWKGEGQVIRLETIC